MKNEMWLIWKQPETRRRYKIGTLTYANQKYIFQYTDPELNEAKETGFDSFPGFEDMNKKYISERLFPNVETRLPNNNRPDYLEILNKYGLKKNSTKMEILTATKGRLITDNYEFVKAFDPQKIEFDIAGTRHCKDIKKCLKLMNINDKLILELDPTNLYDPYAIKIILFKNKEYYHLGYVPRYYSKQITELLKENVNYSALIQSITIEQQLNNETSILVKLIFN